MNAKILKKFILFIPEKFKGDTYLVSKIGAYNNDEVFRSRLAFNMYILEMLNIETFKNYVSVEKPFLTLNDFNDFKLKNSKNRLRNNNLYKKIFGINMDFNSFKSEISSRKGNLKYTERWIKTLNVNSKNSYYNLSLNTELTNIKIENKGEFFLLYLMCSLEPIFDFKGILNIYYDSMELDYNKDNFFEIQESKEKIVKIILKFLRYTLENDFQFKNTLDNFKKLQEYDKDVKLERKRSISYSEKNILIKSLFSVKYKIIEIYKSLLTDYLDISFKDFSLEMNQERYLDLHYLDIKDLEVYYDYAKFYLEYFNKLSISDINVILDALYSIIMIPMKKKELEKIKKEILNNGLNPDSYYYDISQMIKVFKELSIILESIDTVINCLSNKYEKDNIWLKKEIIKINNIDIYISVLFNKVIYTGNFILEYSTIKDNILKNNKYFEEFLEKISSLDLNIMTKLYGEISIRDKTINFVSNNSTIDYNLREFDKIRIQKLQKNLERFISSLEKTIFNYIYLRGIGIKKSVKQKEMYYKTMICLNSIFPIVMDEDLKKMIDEFNKICNSENDNFLNIVYLEKSKFYKIKDKLKFLN